MPAMNTIDEQAPLSANPLSVTPLGANHMNAAPLDAKYELKLAELERELMRYESVAIGFSGGVDSTFLAAVCARCMLERTLLIHLDTALISTPERVSFKREARRLGLPIVTLEVDPLSSPTVAANPADRCYHCKHLLFSCLIAEARARGFKTVLDGSNADDAGDYRPGMRAARELGVVSPLMTCGWHKDEEREVLRAWGHEVWNLPAGACLATRVASGDPLTPEALDMIRSCEDYLHEIGLKQIRVRVSDCGRSTQVTADMDDLMRLAEVCDTAVAEDGSVELSDAVATALEQLGAQGLARTALPYRHGATSIVT